MVLVVGVSALESEAVNCRMTDSDEWNKIYSPTPADEATADSEIVREASFNTSTRDVRAELPGASLQEYQQ